MYWFFFVYHILFRVSLMTHFGSVLLMPVNPFRQICSVWCCLGRDCKSNSLQSYIPIIGHKFSRDYSNSPLFSCSLINKLSRWRNAHPLNVMDNHPKRVLSLWSSYLTDAGCKLSIGTFPDYNIKCSQMSDVFSEEK